MPHEKIALPILLLRKPVYEIPFFGFPPHPPSNFFSVLPSLHFIFIKAVVEVVHYLESDIKKLNDP